VLRRASAAGVVVRHQHLCVAILLGAAAVSGFAVEGIGLVAVWFDQVKGTSEETVHEQRFLGG